MNIKTYDVTKKLDMNSVNVNKGLASNYKEYEKEQEMKKFIIKNIDDQFQLSSGKKSKLYASSK